MLKIAILIENFVIIFGLCFLLFSPTLFIDSYAKSDENFEFSSSNSYIFQSVLKDPRKNSSYYDFIIQDNIGYNQIIGNINEVLVQRKLINRTTIPFNYKLIYYSPQLLPAAYDLNKSKMNDINMELFSVDLNNGSIYIKTANEPTLEYLCMKNSFCSCLACIFNLNVIYSTENRVNAETIRVFVDDKNDYAPEFFAKSAYLTVNVSELSRIGDTFKLEDAVAYDDDAFYNQIVYYISDNDITSKTEKYEQRSNLFDVSILAGGSTNTRDLNLILKTHLDYEKVKSYELFLIAKDNGLPISYKNSKRLLINVIDENDHSPVCEKSLFVAYVHENKLVRNFLQIKATDADTDLNAKLTYWIFSDGPLMLTNDSIYNDQVINSSMSKSSSIGSGSTIFHIDHHTGSLSLATHLDYEKQTTYELIIKVIDSGLRKKRSTYCAARVNVLDVNDNRAKMKVIKYLNESVQRDYYVINTMSNEDSLEAMTTHLVSTQPQLSYVYESFKSIAYDVRSVYDEQPNEIEVYENNNSNIVVALIRVIDKDSIGNYKFLIESATTSSQEDINLFEVRQSDKSNREYDLVVTGSFDSEKIQHYRLKITLFDLEDANMFDEYKRKDSALMIDRNPSRFLADEINFKETIFESINVLDVNDNRPKFVKKFYEFTLKENEFDISINPKKSIEAFDLDTSEANSKLLYKVVDKSSNFTHYASQHIFIDPSTQHTNHPTLILKAPFDYELVGGQFELYLNAYDADNFTDSTAISIRIEDVNDNLPMFMNENATFSIKENMQPNSFVGQVIAVDKDSAGPNSDLSFRIQSDYHNNLFKIFKSGFISNKVSFDRETQSSFVIKIEAFDHGEPRLSSIGTYFIKIEDENDNGPYFVYPNTKTRYMCIKMPTFYESSTFSLRNLTELKVFDMKAKDLDNGENGKLTYGVEEPFDLLYANADNGSVYLNLSRLNFNSTLELNKYKKTFDLKMSVRDGGTPELSSTLKLVLYLNYDAYELPKSVLKALQSENQFDIFNNQQQDQKLTYKGKEFFDELIESESFSFDSAKAKDFFQIVSNGVLIIILLVVLVFMIFVACFILFIVYRKPKNKPKLSKSSSALHKGKTSVANSHESVNGTYTTSVSCSTSSQEESSRHNSAYLRLFKWFERIRSLIKKKISLNNVSSAKFFSNFRLYAKRENQENLTVIVCLHICKLLVVFFVLIANKKLKSILFLNESALGQRCFIM
jgi:hypothetical protein